MASREGFSTEGQTEMLRIAMANAEIVSSSSLASPGKHTGPRSSNQTSLLLSDQHHVEAPNGGQSAAAGGVAVRHVRRSHSGKSIRVKKGATMKFGFGVFDVSSSSKRVYSKLIESIRQFVCISDDKGRYRMCHARRIVRNEPGVFEVDISFTDAEEVKKSMTLFWRRCDLYIIGYAHDGQRFRFRNEVLADAKPLNFSGNYPTLEGYKGLSDVVVGRHELDRAFNTLCGVKKSDKELAGALITIVVNFAESVRFKRIYQAIFGHYLELGQTVPEETSLLVKNWSKISGLLIRAPVVGEEPIQGLQMTLQEALDCISVLKSVRA